jgi:ribosomal protein S12 methylthiotransferase accessory factor
MQIERDHEQHRIGRLVLQITLPDGFPEKHREAVIRAVDLCAVKKHILNPPAFEIRSSALQPASATPVAAESLAR